MGKEEPKEKTRKSMIKIDYRFRGNDKTFWISTNETDSRKEVNVITIN